MLFGYLQSFVTASWMKIIPARSQTETTLTEYGDWVWDSFGPQEVLPPGVFSLQSRDLVRSSPWDRSTANERGREVFQGFSCLTGGPRVIWVCGWTRSDSDLTLNWVFPALPQKVLKEDGIHFIFRDINHGNHFLNVKGSMVLERSVCVGLWSCLFYYKYKTLTMTKSANSWDSWEMAKNHSFT